MPSRILQIITDDDRRGAQVFALDLHEALTKAGHDVRTVALAPGMVGGLDVEILGRARFAISTLRSLRRTARSAKVVIGHGSSTLPACALSGLGTATPFVYRQVSDSLFWAPGGLRRLRVRLAMSRAARVVALWQGAADTLVTHFGVARDRISVIPNGVPPERFVPIERSRADSIRASLGLQPSRSTVAYIGALVPEKGVDLAIDAIAPLNETQLLVVGDGSERRHLEERAREVAQGRVVFTGSLPDPLRALGAADVLVLPSRGGDSMPAVLIEAGLAGLPVVSTPVQGIPDVVADGSTGYLVPIGSVSSLTDAIRNIITDPEHARSLGEEARRRCLENFTIDRVAAQWCQLFDELNASKQGE